MQETKGKQMKLTKVLETIDRIWAPKNVYAHCDLPCGVYDPAQARIEAESIKAIMEKYNASDDQYFRDRAVIIKEQRAAEVNHHLDILWYQYFQPAHLEKYPELHELFWKAKKLTSQAKRTNDLAVADQLLDSIKQIADIFWETKK
jgi:nickel superoxide dismutase